MTGDLWKFQIYMWDLIITVISSSSSLHNNTCMVSIKSLPKRQSAFAFYVEKKEKMIIGMKNLLLYLIMNLHFR